MSTDMTTQLTRPRMRTLRALRRLSPLRAGLGRATAVLCAVAFALSSSPLLADDAGGDRISELEAKVEVLAGEIERLRTEEREAATPTPAVSDGPAADTNVEEKVNVLARELDRLKRAVAVPEEKELKSIYGMGPAASKVYLKDRGLSLGGYGEVGVGVLLNERMDRHNVADALRGVLYVGYKFNDWLVMNTEFEFEHAGTGGGGSVSIEFMTLDFLLNETVNIKAGLLLAPLGFINEIHEPTTFYGVSRPSPEQTIIPTTFREIGAGLFGNLGTDKLRYKIYAMNGLQATGFSANGVRGGRQKGSKALADDWAITARLDYEPLPGLLFGTSLWSGPSGQNEVTTGAGQNVDVWTTIWDVRAQWKYRGFHTRGLFTMAHIGDADALTTSNCGGMMPTATTTCQVAETMLGGYVEAAYDVMPHIFPDTQMRLEPFYRWEISDTQNTMPTGVASYKYADFQTHVVGIQYYPHPQVVIKLNYRNIHANGRDKKGRQRSDDFELGVGFVF